MSGIAILLPQPPPAWRIESRRLYNLPNRFGDFDILKEGAGGLPKGGNVEFVMFEDVDGLEVFVNPERVVWVREYPNQITVISCGHDDKFSVRLAPAHAVAALGKLAR
ncbi:MAG: hypothetical protein ACLPLR_11550 [Terriglobales bacterium]